MNRQEYLRILNKELRRLPRADREQALQYYEEYFEDDGPENEQAVMEELGNPIDIANQIIRDLAIKKMEEPEKSVKHGFSAIWIVILAVFAAPIGLPLAFAFALVIFCVVLVVFIFVACFIFAGICLGAGGLLSLAAGGYLLFQTFADGLAVIGSGLLAAGVGIFILYGSYYLGRLLFAGIARLFRRMLTRGKKKHEKVQ